MIDRVAKAIFDAMEDYRDPILGNAQLIQGFSPFDDVLIDGTFDLRVIAKAVIDAMGDVR